MAAPDERSPSTIFHHLSARFGEGRPLRFVSVIWYWCITVGIAILLRFMDFGSADDWDVEPTSPNGKRVIFVVALLFGGAIIGALMASSKISDEFRRNSEHGWGWRSIPNDADLRTLLWTSVASQMVLGGIFLSLGLELLWLMYREWR